jgi:hypothetical protein
VGSDEHDLDAMLHVSRNAYSAGWHCFCARPA